MPDPLDKPVAVQLTQDEKEFILVCMMSLPEEYDRAIRASSGDQPISLTVAEWEDLAACIAQDAKHTKNPNLSRIVQRIHGQLRSEEAVRWSEFTASLIATADNIGLPRNDVVADVSFPPHELLILFRLPLSAEVIELLRDSCRTPAVRLSFNQLAAVCFAAAEAVMDTDKASAERLTEIVLRTSVALSDCIDNGKKLARRQNRRSLHR